MPSFFVASPSVPLSFILLELELSVARPEYPAGCRSRSTAALETLSRLFGAVRTIQAALPASLHVRIHCSLSANVSRISLASIILIILFPKITRRC